MDQALRRLGRALPATGTRAHRSRRGIRRTLREIAETVAPLSLPAEVETFWRSIDPRCLHAAPPPRPMSAEFALESWRSRERPGRVPPVLFPVCHEGGEYLLVELAEQGTGEGGACFGWQGNGSPFRLRLSTFTTYVDLLATMLELGELHRGDPGAWPGRWSRIDAGRWADALAVRLAGELPHPRFGASPVVGPDPREWPAAWRAAWREAAAPGSSGPTTIAELTRRVGSGRAVTGTITARVLREVGSAVGIRVVVTDGTGELDVWCPDEVAGRLRSADGAEPGARHAFDVVLTPVPRLSGDQVDGHRLVMDLDLVAGYRAGPGPVGSGEWPVVPGRPVPLPESPREPATTGEPPGECVLAGEPSGECVLAGEPAASGSAGPVRARAVAVRPAD